MFTALVNALSFLINSLADLYVFILIIRALLVWVHADYANPMTELVVKLTEPLVRPLKRLIPNFKRDLESATLVLIIGIELLKFFVIGLLSLNLVNVFGLALLSLADALKLTIDVFFYAILMQVILSWLPYSYNGVYRLLTQITAPLMRPLRRLIPPVGGIDISPIPAIIGLQFIGILLIDPIYATGMSLAFGQ